MALTTTITVKTNYTPEVKLVRADVAFDSSYPTGGEELDLTSVLDKIDAAWVGSQSMADSTKFIKIDDTNFSSGKMNLEVHDTTDEEADESDQSGVDDIVIYAIGSHYAA